jgi:signal transduction histidine kinase
VSMTPAPVSPTWRFSGVGLSAKLLILTSLFVLLAEVLIFVPSVANFRRTWLNDRIAAAQVAALVLEGAPREGLPEGIEMQLLDGVGAQAIAVRVAGTRRLLARDEMPMEVGRTVDLRGVSAWESIMQAFTVLLYPVKEPIRIIDAGMGRADFVEIVIDERPLRRAMLAFSRNILLLSLFISGITASLVYLALHVMIVRPVRRLAHGIAAFEADPENPARIIHASGRKDELGEAEAALSRMQVTLAGEFRRKTHLAALGLAVSKINHDLRNMLAAAQLWSDRLTDSTDPLVKRFAPRLIGTLDRAIVFCQSTLSYGKASEAEPVLRQIRLRSFLDDVAALLGISDSESNITFDNRVDAGFVIIADPDQMNRVFTNLIRNAAQALGQDSAEHAGNAIEMPRITTTAEKRHDGSAIIIADNGPGIPAQAKAHLFEAFQGSVGVGGTGLGLAIAAELVRLHGGQIVLEENGSGARFVITFPHSAQGRA